MDITRNYQKFSDTVQRYGLNPNKVGIYEALKEVGEHLLKEIETHAICPRCGEKLYCSDLPNYAFVCINCDENFFEIEVKH